MKKRFLSFLLSAVMLLALLPVSAFAADDTDTDKPEIEVYFYADGKMADKKAGSLYGKGHNIDTSDDKATSGNVANTMVVFCRDLNPRENYTLMLEYPEGAIKDKDSATSFDKSFIFYEDEDKCLRTIAKLNADSKSEGDKYDKLCAFRLNVTGTDFTKHGSGEYTVTLYKSTLDAQNFLDSSEVTETITLDEVTIDFGVKAVPDDILESETNNKYYRTVSIDGSSNNVKTAVSLYVDSADIPNSTGLKDSEIRDYFDSLIRLQSSAEGAYKKDSRKRWFKEGDKTFAWRTQLLDTDIHAAPLYDVRVGENHVENLFAKGTYAVKVDGERNTGVLSPADAVNTVKISVEDLVEHRRVNRKTNKEELGGWVGFTVDRPDDAIMVRYITGSNQNFGEPTVEGSEWIHEKFDLDEEGEVIENEVEGVVIGKHSFYIDAFKENPASYCGIQYLGEGNVPVTRPYIFQINKDAVKSSKAAIISSVLSTNGYETKASIPTEILENLSNNAQANDTLIIDSSEIVDHPNAANLRILTSEVEFTKDGLEAVQDFELTIKTPIGSIKLPASKLPKGSNNTRLVMKRIHRDNILEWANFGENVVFDTVPMDSIEITAYADGVLKDISLGTDETVELTLKLDTVSIPDEDDTTKAYEEKNVDLLSFQKNKKGMIPTVKPEVIQRGVPYVADKKEVKFLVGDLSLYYGIMQRIYVDKMHTIDNRKIEVLEPDKTNLLSNFDGYAASKTYSIKTRAKELTITTTDAARLKEGSTITQAKREWTVDLSQITKKKIEIKIGVDVYTLDITRYLGDGEELELKHDFTVIPGMDKITVTNAKKGRFYYVQCNKVKPNPNPASSNRWKSLGVSYSVLKKETDEDLVVYVSANTGEEEDRYIIFSIWEISEGATEPIVLNSAGEFEMVFDETKDRHTEGLLIDPTQLS